MTRYLFIICLLVLMCDVLSAQTPPAIQPDSNCVPDSQSVYLFDESSFNYGLSSGFKIDSSSLTGFQIPVPFIVNTGNLGSPVLSLLSADKTTDPVAFRYDHFRDFGFNDRNRNFYHALKPITRLNYYVGQRREQFVNVSHFRNFGDNFNFSFQFQRVRSEGFYRRQNTSNTSVRANSWYRSPGRRYAFLADLYWTGVNIAENGGLENDSSFLFANQIDRQLNAIRLDNAGNLQRKRMLWTSHYFSLGSVIDTITLDSTRIVPVIQPVWALRVTSSIEDQMFKYQDAFPTSGYYSSIYRDSLQTSDSAYLWKLNSAAEIVWFNQKRISAALGTRLEAGEFFQDTLYRSFSNLFMQGELRWQFQSVSQPFCSRSCRISPNVVVLKGWYISSGLNSGNYLVSLNFNLSNQKQTMLLYSDVKLRRTTVPLLYSNYSGNHYRWAVSSDDIMENTILAGASVFGKEWLRYVEASAYFNQMKGMVVLDSLIRPVQNNSSVSHFRVSVKSELQFGWLHSVTSLHFNQVSDKEWVRLPSVYAFQSLFADLKLFRKKMRLQIGFDANWFSSYYAPGYSPVMSQFYLQNSIKTGNYIYIDPWVSMQIKTVRFFFKAEHTNAGLMGRNYFLLPHYPHNDLALKLGISWNFSD